MSRRLRGSHGTPHKAGKPCHSVELKFQVKAHQPAGIELGQFLGSEGEGGLRLGVCVHLADGFGSQLVQLRNHLLDLALEHRGRFGDFSEPLLEIVTNGTRELFAGKHEAPRMARIVRGFVGECGGRSSGSERGSHRSTCMLVSCGD